MTVRIPHPRVVIALPWWVLPIYWFALFYIAFAFAVFWLLYQAARGIWWLGCRGWEAWARRRAAGMVAT